MRVRADEWERAEREAPGEEERLEQAPAGDQRGGRVERPEVLASERHALQAVGEQRRPRAALHQTFHRVRRQRHSTRKPSCHSCATLYFHSMKSSMLRLRSSSTHCVSTLLHSVCEKTRAECLKIKNGPADAMTIDVVRVTAHTSLVEREQLHKVNNKYI